MTCSVIRTTNIHLKQDPITHNSGIVYGANVNE